MSQHVIGPTAALKPSHAVFPTVATCIPLTYPKLADVIGLVMMSVAPAGAAASAVQAHL